MRRGGGERYRFRVTDALLIALIVVLVLSAAGAVVLAQRARTALDRRLKRLERRIDDLVARPAPIDPAAALAELLELRDHADDEQSTRVVEALQRSTSEVVRRIDARTSSIQRGKQSIEQRTRRAVATDVHALLTLHSALPIEAESLALTSYSAEPDTILHLTTLIAALPDDALVVEFGSGLSTVWMSAAARHEARGIRIVSIDHDERWGAETRAALKRLGLDAVAEVRVAPLAPLPGAGEGDTPWYGLEALDGLDDIRLLVVDGPPAATGVDARYPAVPSLAASLAADARVVLDDTDRDEERAIAERWIAELGPERGAIVERVLDRTTVIRLGGPEH